VLRGNFQELAAPQPRWQRDGPEPHPHQAAHRQSQGLEQPAHDAVAAFLQHDAVPAIGALAAFGCDGYATRHAVVQPDARQQPCRLRLGQLPAHPHRVLALETVARVHHAIGELPGRREQQQTAAVEVETADRRPFRVAQPRQPVKDARAAAGIIAADDLALGLVIEEHLRQPRGFGCAQQAAIDHHHVACADPGAEPGSCAIDRDAAGLDPLFHLAPRSEPRLRERLLQLAGCFAAARRPLARHKS